MSSSCVYDLYLVDVLRTLGKGASFDKSANIAEHPKNFDKRKQGKTNPLTEGMTLTLMLVQARNLFQNTLKEKGHRILRDKYSSSINRIRFHPKDIKSEQSNEEQNTELTDLTDYR
jgi:hypothetical protein